MKLFQGVRLKAAEMRQFEEKLFEVVAKEVEQNDIRPGLWAKAFAESDGDGTKARAAYLKLRVQSLKDQLLQLDDALQAAEALCRKYSGHAADGASHVDTAGHPDASSGGYVQSAEERAWFDEQARLDNALTRKTRDD